MNNLEVDQLGQVPVDGRDEPIRVRRVFCVGRNYAEHTREMGHDDREPPFFFGKAPEALVTNGKVAYPPATKDLHHEVELVLLISKMASDIAPEAVTDVIGGYTVGIDFTRRDVQSEAKRLARPWYLSKSFIGSGPIGTIKTADKIGHPRKGRIWLEVNGALRQNGDLEEMVWSVEDIVSQLSAMDTLLPGDLVFTGTPAGVGAVSPGDTVKAGVEGVDEILIKID